MNRVNLNRGRARAHARTYSSFSLNDLRKDRDSEIGGPLVLVWTRVLGGTLGVVFSAVNVAFSEARARAHAFGLVHMLRGDPNGSHARSLALVVLGTRV